MSPYALNVTLDSLRSLTIMLVDIFILWLVIFYTIKIVRSNSRTIQIFKGILLVIIIDVISKIFGLRTLAYFADMFINWGFLAIIIVFQPEIRSILEKLGKTNVFSRITTLTGNEKENLVDQIVKATMLLSKDQTGALISIEQSQSLEDYIGTGTKLNSDLTAELLTSIFVTSTPLHDGAVIIQGDKIACASAYFPPTNLDLPSRYGARHRAAIGISEITDAVTIVVSEETGQISITEAGKIYAVNRRQLRDYLLRVICGEETEVTGQNQPVDLPQEVVITQLKMEDVQPKKDASKTGVLNKLAIKKQEQKIEVEEVVYSKPTEEVEKKKRSLFSFHRKPKQQPEQENKIHELEEEISDIKLPKKKERPIPSYPDQPEHHFVYQNEERVETMENTAKQVEEVEQKEEVQPVEQTVDRVESYVEQHKRPASNTMRMSAEEVAAERQRIYEQLSGKTQEQPVVHEEEKKPEKYIDVSKIDPTKVMGFDDIQDATKLVDQLDDEEIDIDGGDW